MNIVISGASGLVGTALQERLRAEGHSVTNLVRKAPSNANESQWDPVAGTIDTDVIAQADAVINLSGAELVIVAGASRIGRHSSTAGRSPRLSSHPRLLHCERWIATNVAETPLRSAFMALEAMKRSPKAANTAMAFSPTSASNGKPPPPAQEAGVRAVHLRTGIVMSKRGGVLKKLLPLFKLGLGGRLGSGRQWQSWISIDDEVGAIVHLLSTSTEGAVNLTAPNPVTNKEFTGLSVRRCAAQQSSASPASLQSCSWDPIRRRTAAHRATVLPTKLQESGYEFTHQTLEEALAAVL